MDGEKCGDTMVKGILYYIVLFSFGLVFQPSHGFNSAFLPPLYSLYLVMRIITILLRFFMDGTNRKFFLRLFFRIWHTHKKFDQSNSLSPIKAASNLLMNDIEEKAIC